MSEHKYIIKNCPCYENEGVFYNCINEYIEGDCQDCANCIMKKIVEKCRNKIRIYECYNGDYALGKVKCAESILQLLDTQEVE